MGQRNIEPKTWLALREQCVTRDNHKCVLCKKSVKEKSFVADHIKPITMGGALIDLNNLQTLCVKCNKIKTSNDIKLIAIERAEKRARSGIVVQRKIPVAIVIERVQNDWIKSNRSINLSGLVHRTIAIKTLSHLISNVYVVLNV